MAMAWLGSSLRDEVSAKVKPRRNQTLVKMAGGFCFVSILRCWASSSMVRPDCPAILIFNVLQGNRVADPDDAACFPGRNFAYQGVIWEADERDG
jgi:hypothetical protein